jgi:hypothetical protein
MSQPALDLSRIHGSQKHGDLTVYLTWWLASDGGPRPCLVLLPTDQSRWQYTQPCVVLLDQAWQWSEEIGDPAYAARMSMQFAASLGLSAADATNVFRVRSAIVDHLGDLLAMPPMPTDMREPGVVLGDVTVKEDGKIVREEELTDG